MSSCPQEVAWAVRGGSVEKRLSVGWVAGPERGNKTMILMRNLTNSMIL